MSSISLSNDRIERVAGQRLLWVGPLTIALAVLAVVLVRLVAVNLLGIGADFPPLGWGPPIAFTIIGVLGAVIVFAIVARFAKRPLQLFRRIALVVLMLSLVPDVLLLISQAMPGTSLASILTLMIMHGLVWAITVRLLTTKTSVD